MRSRMYKSGYNDQNPKQSSRMAWANRVRYSTKKRYSLEGLCLHPYYQPRRRPVGDTAWPVIGPTEYLCQIESVS